MNSRGLALSGFRTRTVNAQQYEPWIIHQRRSIPLVHRGHKQHQRAGAMTTPGKFLQSLPNLEGLHLMVPNDEHVRSPSPILDLTQHPEEPQLPSSFATQMAMATGARGGVADLMLRRMVLSRIGNLEESMKDVKLILHEVKKLNNKGKEKTRSLPDEEFEEKSREGEERQEPWNCFQMIFEDLQPR
ncbi:hypothetical protein B9Z19DRAFT_1064890 [Tuber borchii]|uniref:Uncharacterized protein n=1 Tax=Tuber borchii TaxID=42251 RepID=A0A2T6ZT27_TUBBO|nr:hypothetical protein B9Z19DRAFT_1064890 [Tuber borchii]